MIITSRYNVWNLKFKQFMFKRYILVRKRFLKEWTKISEENRKSFFLSLFKFINILYTSLLLSVPITLLTTISLWKSVICFLLLLHFFEHYYVWVRENWKDDILK